MVTGEFQHRRAAIGCIAVVIDDENPQAILSGVVSAWRRAPTGSVIDSITSRNL
jgi:hypothetical protein